MMTIKARNVNDAYVNGLWWLKTSGQQEQSRNGEVIVSPEPVMTVYSSPQERVLLDSARDANPFFHLYEAIWMLAGARDVRKVAHYASNMLSYSDDGETLNGAYGDRWRNYYDVDQLLEIVDMLRTDITTRRAVLAMWNGFEDLCSESKDIPCNTHIYFRMHPGRTLDTTVCCRSNDVIWGAYGANAVHFSVLHEFMARAVGATPGKLYQFSNNYHIYEPHWKLMRAPALEMNPYDNPIFRAIPLFAQQDEYILFLKGCEEIAATGHNTRDVPFLRNVVMHMLDAWEAHKDKDAQRAYTSLSRMPDCDWQVAGMRWIDRHEKVTG